MMRKLATLTGMLVSLAGQGLRGRQAKKRRSSESDGRTFHTIFDEAGRGTLFVERSIKEEFEKTPELEFLVKQFGSYVFNAAQKLIDRKLKTGETRVQDEAVILACPRLFSECFAGHRLARSGLVLQSIVLLRSAFEITSQAVLFMENEEMARRWLIGEQIAPRNVRRKSRFAAAHRDLYRHLSALAHPNLEALGYYSVPVWSGSAVALSYGGGFFPKAAGQIATQLLYAELVFLEVFYTVYERDLDQHGLLWLPGMGAEERGAMTWAKFLQGWRRALDDLLNKYNSLPDDGLALSDYVMRTAEPRP